MKKTYRLQILNRRGMYTYGESAATQRLAQLVPGNMIIKEGDLLGIEECVWGQSISGGDSVIRNIVLVSAEEFPGQWEIGVKGGEKYRAAKA